MALPDPTGFPPGMDAAPEPLSDAMRQQLIEDLDRSRIGFGIASASTGEAFLRSATCGDEVRVQVSVEDGILVALNWQGHGCTVSTASASALCEVATGMPVAEFHRQFERFSDSVWNGVLPDDDLGDAAVFAGIGRLPLRGGCATLAWRAAAEAVAA